LASGRTITLSWGAKKKEHNEQSTLLSDESLQVGNLVVVENHGDQWPHKAHIVDINIEYKWALIRWETTQKIDYVDVGDLKQFSMEDSTPRKQKSTDYISPLSGKKISSNEHPQNDRSGMQCCTKNKFYSVKNSSKLCAEGAIGNLMNVLRCHAIEVNQFWATVQSPMHLILETLNESSVPKAMLKSSGECDSIQKSLWILRKQFKFSTTKLL
jgi:hypothetical protein